MIKFFSNNILPGRGAMTAVALGPSQGYYVVCLSEKKTIAREPLFRNVYNLENRGL